MDLGSNAPFCPQCGTDLSADNRRRRVLFRRIDRNVRHGTSAAVILVAIISVLAVVLSALPSGDVGSSTEDSGPPDGAIIIDDRTYIVLSDGFSRYGLDAELDASGQLVLTIPGYDGDASDFVWEMRNDSAGTVSYITKKEPILTWMKPSIGDWTFIVSCCGQEKQVFTGSLTCYGDSISSYSWVHSGMTFTISYKVALETYDDAAGWASGRNEDTLKAASAFVSSDEAVVELEGKIWSVYSSALGGAHNSTDYAMCLASFVSSCITERQDIVSYGVSVYNAYPVETLYRGYGDSCDISILTASLMKAAGIGAGLAKMPDMWAVGIVVRGPSSNDSETLMSITIDDLRYWITSLTPYRGIGVVPDAYGYDGGFMYYGQEAGDGYGFITVENTL